MFTRMSFVIEGSALVALILDWKQTLKIARNPLLYSETNKILGKHPSVAEVNRYFIAVIALQILAYKMLPSDYALAMAAVVAGVETWQVLENKKHGL